MAKHELDNGNNYHDNDNDKCERGEQAIAPAPAGGALTSLAALSTALNAVDTTTVTGRSGLPTLAFKRDGSGTWLYGQRRTIVEDGSSWAVNPTSFKWGAICFNNNNKVVAERLVPVSQPKPDIAELPDTGFAWQEEWTVNMKCLSGADAGKEVAYKPTTVGGIQAVAGLIEVIRDRLNDNQHGGKVSPVVHLEKDSYPHEQHGKVWTPVLTIIDWMPLSGPGPAPTSPPPPEQPRRRRAA